MPSNMLINDSFSCMSFGSLTMRGILDGTGWLSSYHYRAEQRRKFYIEANAHLRGDLCVPKNARSPQNLGLGNLS